MRVRVGNSRLKKCPQSLEIHLIPTCPSLGLRTRSVLQRCAHDKIVNESAKLLGEAYVATDRLFCSFDYVLFPNISKNCRSEMNPTKCRTGHQHARQVRCAPASSTSPATVTCLTLPAGFPPLRMVSPDFNLSLRQAHSGLKTVPYVRRFWEGIKIEQQSLFSTTY